MSYYQYHIFFCTNERSDGTASCRGQAMRDYAKQRVKSLGLDGVGVCRVSSAGCLGRCDAGPLLVIYPKETWYTYVDEQDIDEIIEQHLLNGQPVVHLKR